MQTRHESKMADQKANAGSENMIQTNRIEAEEDSEDEILSLLSP